MKRAAKFFLIPFIFLIVSKADARVEWNEPEVVPEKLVRKNRRVLRFSGTTRPGAQVRIRKNTLKLYLANGKIRNSKIPQKNRIQFPVVADEDGQFSFDLYLPTIAVQIPVQVRHKKRWKTYALNFRVPDEGAADDFQATEESFRASDEKVERLDKDENYYSRKNDQGMYIQDRHGKRKKQDKSFEYWGGLGLSYFSTSVSTPTAGIDGSGSTIVIPSFRVGLDWDYSPKWKIKSSIRSSSGEVSGLASGGTVTGESFSWLEVQAGAVWFADMMKMKKGRMGLDFGLQLQTLPLFRDRPGFINEAFFDNTTYNLHIGVFYEKTNNREWNYEMFGRYLYPISSGDEFSIESSFPLFFEFGGGIKRQMTQGMALGIFGQLHYISMDVDYFNVTANPTDLTLMLMTVDVRLIGHF